MAGKMGDRDALSGDESRHLIRQAVTPNHRDKGHLVHRRQGTAQVNCGVQHIARKTHLGRTIRARQGHFNHGLSDTGDFHGGP